jgi:hypothetical protein
MAASVNADEAGASPKPKKITPKPVEHEDDRDLQADDLVVVAGMARIVDMINRIIVQVRARRRRHGRAKRR